jgi:NAD-dependent deacetylase
MREEPMAELGTRIERAQRLFVLTGAGMSAESGIATFRDALTGLWSRFDPAQLASEEGFRADPRACGTGTPSARTACAPRSPTPAIWRSALRAPPPRCAHVGDSERRRPAPARRQRRHHPPARRHPARPLARPCARMPACDPSGRTGRPPRCADAATSCARRWCGSARCCRPTRSSADARPRVGDVALIVGTSGAVWPAAGLAALARRAGALVAIVNPNESEIDDAAHVALRATAAQALPQLLERR